MKVRGRSVSKGPVRDRSVSRAEDRGAEDRGAEDRGRSVSRAEDGAEHRSRSVSKKKRPSAYRPPPPPPTHVGIYIECHGKFSSQEDITSPGGIELMKYNRSGYGCLSYIGYDSELTSFSAVNDFELAQLLARDKFKMSSHTDYVAHHAETHKASPYFHLEAPHVSIQGEECSSTNGCKWRMTEYTPETRDSRGGTFQIYVDHHRRIDLWHCFEPELIKFLNLGSDPTFVAVQQELIRAVLTRRRITTGHLFNIIRILKSQGHMKFNIADYACHVEDIDTPVPGRHVVLNVKQPSSVKRLGSNYGGRKTKRKSARSKKRFK
jgi:hypothetical protein